MLLEISIKNFRSIKEEQVFTMLSEKRIHEHSDSIIEKAGSNILKTAVLYGRNASGKSNLLKAFDALQYLVLRSDTFKKNDSIRGYDPFKLDKACESQPVEIGITFIAKDNVKYNYQISFLEDSILNEKLTFYPKGQPAKLFERVFEKKITYGEYFGGKRKEIEESLYDNQLFLSKVGSSKVKQLSFVFDYFSLGLYTSIIHDTDYDDVLIRLFTNKMAKGDIPNFNSNIGKLMKAADTGIESLVISEIKLDESSLPEDMSTSEKQDLIERYKYQIRTIHKVFSGNTESGEKEFRLSDESTGTLKLLAVGGLILEALADGQTLLIDELDKSLHPNLTKVLVRLFQDSTTNPNNAQLIFATHDTSLLDNELFRRDQVWFVEKEYEGWSHFYSISDIPGVRSDVPFDKWYMSGRFGATAVINEYELNFDH